MKKNAKKKGFTLVELLAIIIVITVVALITVPVVLNVIETSKISAFKSGVKKLYDAAKIYIMEEETEVGITAEQKTFLFPDANDELKYSGKKIINGTLIYDSVKESYVINVTDGNYCANGIISDLKVERGNCEINDQNGPEKIDGIAIFKNTKSLKILITAEDNDTYISSLWIKKGNDPYQQVNIEEKGKFPKKATGIINFDGLTMNTNYIFTIKAIDGKGNANVKTMAASTLNLPLPIITLNNNNPTKNPIEATITYPKRKIGENYEYGYKIYINGVLKLTEIINDQTLDKEIFKKVIVNNEKTIIIAYVSDKINIAQTQKNITNYDITPPDCTSSGGNVNWTNTNIVLTGVCSDSITGCVGNITKTYSTNINSNIESPGVVSDKAGNQISCPANQQVHIDKTSPTVSGGSISLSGSTLMLYASGATDTGGSGIKDYLFKYTTTSSAPTYESGGWYSRTVANAPYTVSNVCNGYYYGWVIIRDNANNISAVRSIGNTPCCQIPSSGTACSSGQVNQTLTCNGVTITCRQEISGWVNGTWKWELAPSGGCNPAPNAVASTQCDRNWEGQRYSCGGGVNPPNGNWNYSNRCYISGSTITEHNSTSLCANHRAVCSGGYNTYNYIWR